MLPRLASAPLDPVPDHIHPRAHTMGPTAHLHADIVTFGNDRGRKFAKMWLQCTHDLQSATLPLSDLAR